MIWNQICPDVSGWEMTRVSPMRWAYETRASKLPGPDQLTPAPQQRAGQPAELGAAALFLCSDASSFVTGSILTADGGYTAV